MRSFLSLILIVATAPPVFAVENASAEIGAAENKKLADPTRPSGYSESVSVPTTPSEKLSLTLIRLGAQPHAVINGTTVAPGESIAGYRLLSLQTTNAILSGPNGRTVLQLAPTIRKSSPTHSVQNR